MKKFFDRRNVFQNLSRKYKSDQFKCSNCGRVIYIKVLGDTCRCSECGGTMHRL